MSIHDTPVQNRYMLSRKWQQRFFYGDPVYVLPLNSYIQTFYCTAHEWLTPRSFAANAISNDTSLLQDWGASISPINLILRKLQPNYMLMFYFVVFAAAAAAAEAERLTRVYKI